MVDIASLTWDLVKDALAIVGKGLEYKSTRKNMEATVKDVSPLVEEIENSLNRMNLPSEHKRHIQKLKKMLAKNTEDLENQETHGWNYVLGPWRQRILSRGHASVEGFISVQTQIQMLHLLTEILSVLNSLDRSLERDNTHDGRTQTFNDRHLHEIFPPRFTVGLDGNSMQYLEAKLLHTDEQVLNLYGMPGSGKTTMAKKLICCGLQVRGKFKKNIIFETLGSQIQVDEAIVKKLRDQVSEYGEDPVLLVLDDVWPRSENIVEMINLISPESRILVTSRAPMTTVGSRCQMKLLCDEDAEKLLRHLVQPSDVDFDDPERRKILLQILEGCKGLPLALEFIGRKIARNNGSIEAFQEVQLEWSQGHSILDSHEDLLARLQNSVDKSIRDYFMDLGIFPEDKKIPITALIDVWIELYDLNEPRSLYAKLNIDKLIAMNLADIKIRWKIGRDDVDNYYNNYDLVQHDLFRELAIHMSKQEPLEKRRRLIIDIYGNPNDPPEWWPKQQSVAAPPILSISTDQNITPDWCNIQAAATVILVLNLRTAEYTLPEFIKEMENLRVLIVTNYGLCKTDLRNLQLLGSLLSLKRIRLKKLSIPSLCDLKNVRKLSLYMCDVKNAFENSSIDISEAMPKLEDLSIEYCEDLLELPTGLCHIITMKNLNISSCHKFIRLPEEIGGLENLKILRINCCAAFEKMPDSTTKLKNLIFLDISFCGSLKKLPDTIGELRNLTKLYMTGSPIGDLPDSVMNLNKLESVICDEDAFHLWEVFTSYLSRLDIKKGDKDVNLNWLSFEFGFQGFFI